MNVEQRVRLKCGRVIDLPSRPSGNFDADLIRPVARLIGGLSTDAVVIIARRARKDRVGVLVTAPQLERIVEIGLGRFFKNEFQVRIWAAPVEGESARWIGAFDRKAW